MRAALLAALVGLWCLASASASARADFGVESGSFNAIAANSADPANEWEANPADPATQAGSHPFITTVGFAFNTKPTPNVSGQPILYEDAKDAKTLLPAGVVGNPTAASVCLEGEFENGPSCAVSSQVGTAEIRAPQLGEVATFKVPLFNVAPEPGKPGELGFTFGGVPFHISISAKGSNGYRLESEASNLTQWSSIYEVHVNIWGVPGDARHDAQRTKICNFPLGDCVGGDVPYTGHDVQPFFSLPTQCGAPLSATLATDSWQQPGRFLTYIDEMEPMTGCGSLEFEPTIAVQPKTPQAGAPAGYGIDINVPQSSDPDGLATSHVKDVSMTLPKGVAINPASANGLSACTDAQVAIGSDEAVTCPDSSKIGNVRVDTPLLANPLSGSMYLGTQLSNDPQSGRMFRLFLVASGSGVTIKLPGQVKADPVTGQLSTLFADNPQMPFEKLHVDLFEGAGASLVNPSQCGAYTTEVTLTSWSGKTVESDSTFTTSSDGKGAPCPPLRFSPSFDAGTANPVAGAYAPFILRLQRSDGDQEFSALRSLNLPPGVSASLRGTTYCSDSALAAADTSKIRGHTGAKEMATPSCPASSLIGSATVGAGPGPNPFYVGSGKVYLAGPYKGAPLSIAASIPAVAGPFDLGNVIVRSALYVDPSDVSIRAGSDPFPTILGGIPLQVKDIRLNLDRPHFTLNPTSCDRMNIASTIIGTGGALAFRSARFQVGDCGRLALKPKLALKFTGQTHRSAHPALKATLTMPEGEANLGKAVVLLPKTEFIDNAHISNPCTPVQFDAGACPKASILGTATAYTPLLDQPLRGPVYFRSNGGARELPDLVADLGGQIHVTLVGYIDSVKTGPETARVRTRFVNVPDAPVSKFVLNMKGGDKGLLVNNTELCRAKPRAKAEFTGQNGKRSISKPLVKIGCKSGKKR